MPSLPPDLEDPNQRNMLEKLVHGMLFFVGTFALTGLLGVGLWVWLGQEDGTPALPLSSGNATRIEGSRMQIPSKDTSIHPAPVDTKAGDNVDARLQGPDAGQLVAPPTRDVTPNYQLSPLHQTQPLARAAGNPLPPPPKQEPLPQIFRKVVVESPTELELTVGKNRIVLVKLAHVLPPDAERQCWFAGQQASCSTLAKTALQRYIRRRAVGCDWIEPPINEDSAMGAEAMEDATGHQMARCYLGRGLKDRKPGESAAGLTDLSSWLVRFGWAEPMVGYYSDERQEALGQERGIYATSESSGGEEARSRQAEIRELSESLDDVAGDIAPLSSSTQSLGASATEADNLTLMQAPTPVEERPLGPPPGFE